MSLSKHIVGLAFVAVALVSGVSADASANEIIDGAATLGPDAFDLRMQAREAFGEPRVRSEPGFIRVWFRGMTTGSMDRAGDGVAVRFVRVRPGFEDTSVVIIRLASMRRIAPSSITVARDGSVAHIRISRSSLGLPAPVVERPAPVAEPVPAPVVEPVEAVSAEAEAEQLAAAPPATEEVVEEATAEEAETAAPETEEAAPPPALGRRSAAAPIPAGSGPSTTVVLIVITMLLGGGYLALRFFRQRGVLPSPLSDIDVVSRKRIGARHQLIVVRALGEEHLLAVQAGRTDLIASVPARPAASGGGRGRHSEESGELPFLQLGAKAEGEGAPRVFSRAQGLREDRPRFGAELMRLAGERSSADEVSLSSSPVGGASDAVAGLLRLREKLGR